MKGFAQAIAFLLRVENAVSSLAQGADVPVIQPVTVRVGSEVTSLAVDLKLTDAPSGTEVNKISFATVLWPLVADAVEGMPFTETLWVPTQAGDLQVTFTVTVI